MIEEFPIITSFHQIPEASPTTTSNASNATGKVDNDDTILINNTDNTLLAYYPLNNADSDNVSLLNKEKTCRLSAPPASFESFALSQEDQRETENNKLQKAIIAAEKQCERARSRSRSRARSQSRSRSPFNKESLKVNFDNNTDDLPFSSNFNKQLTATGAEPIMPHVNDNRNINNTAVDVPT